MVSNPATSTTFETAGDHSSPLKPLYQKGFPESPSVADPVSSGLDWPPEAYKIGTSGTQVDILHARMRRFGTPECARFRRNILDRHPLLATPLAVDYLRTAQRQDYVAANRRLLALDERLCRGDLNLSGSDDELRFFCSRQAAFCSGLLARTDQDDAWQTACERATHYGIQPPPCPPGTDRLPLFLRMADRRWWLRQVRRLQARTLEAIARDLGLVNAKRSSYASPFATSRRHHQKERNRRHLESKVAINEQGQAFSLLDISQRTVSNPAVRRAELMVRIRGFEQVARLCGHVGEFYTLSAPGCMHAYIKTGKANPNYIGTNPRQVNKHLNKQWQLIRAELHRQGLTPYGFRVAEPHHDGTPHWHMLLFMPPEQKASVRRIMSLYALRSFPDEKGAKRHRFKAIAIDPERGSAAGYIAKYIAKNIDGAHLDRDKFGNSADAAATHIDAWASTWGIRQFQPIGGPSVTVWRELRRLKNKETDTIEPARTAADASDWAAYCLAMGGVHRPRKDRPIAPLYEPHESVDPETGEVLADAFTRYGDLKPPRLVGLQTNTGRVRTRLHVWRVALAGELHLRPGATPVLCGAAALPGVHLARGRPLSPAERGDTGAGTAPLGLV